MDDDANRLLELSQGWPHLLKRGNRLIEVKITLFDSSLQMDDDVNKLLEPGKGDHICLMEVKITLIDHSIQMDDDANSLLGLNKVTMSPW